MLQYLEIFHLVIDTTTGKAGSLYVKAIDKRM